MGMTRKSQLTGKAIIFILAAIIGLLAIAFGAGSITKIASVANERKAISFSASLQNALEAHTKTPSGSVKQQTFSLPEKIELVCFADRNSAIDTFANSELNDEAESYENENMFFMPSGIVKPKEIKWLSLEASENPLCVKASDGKLRLKFTSRKESSTVQAAEPSDEKSECVSVLYNGDYENSIDIVFLGYGFESVQEFEKNVGAYVSIFSETEPLKSNIEKVNFYRIDDFQELGCKSGNYIQCNSYKVKQLAAQCPNDYIYVLAERGKFSEVISPVRSSSIGDIMHINTADIKNVALHEFGHSFAELADEYVDDYYRQIRFEGDNYPNCDSAECPKWSGLEDTGCFKGCSTEQYFRPTENSIMRDLNSDYFGHVSDSEISRRIGAYD